MLNLTVCWKINKGSVYQNNVQSKKENGGDQKGEGKRGLHRMAVERKSGLQ